jgi:hypothetical protein
MSVTMGDYSRGPALSRSPCATCGSETLHQANKCIHCGQGSQPDRQREAKLDTLNVYRVFKPTAPKVPKVMGRPHGPHSKKVSQIEPDSLRGGKIYYLASLECGHKQRVPPYQAHAARVNCKQCSLEAREVVA